MTVEPWADPELSAQLPRLCRAGEGQSLEFKSELPAQQRDLAKEIAALSSSDGGLVLIGVEDSGTVCGVPDAHSAAARDALCRRIVGICEKVDPPVRPRLSWAVIDGLGVLGIAVDKGSEPLYYVEQRAYIRHSTVSRPATPAEIAEAITARIVASPKDSPAVDADLSSLADLLATVLVWCDTDSDMRNLRPWVDEWTALANYSASALRQFAASDWANANNQAARLEATADKLDEVANFQHFLSGGDSFDEVCAELRNDAASLMQDLVWPVPIGDENEEAVRNGAVTHSRRLASLWARAEKDVFDGRVEKAQEEASAIGKRMACWTYYKLAIVPEEALVELRRIGLQLFQLQAERTYMDGGESLRRIVRQGRALADDLASVVQRFFLEAAR